MFTFVIILHFTINLCYFLTLLGIFKTGNKSNTAVEVSFSKYYHLCSKLLVFIMQIKTVWIIVKRTAKSKPNSLVESIS